MHEIERRAKVIKLVIFDVDGVLTDGSLILGNDGQEYKMFNTQDGHGMKLLRQSGVEIGVITARRSELVRRRMESLGVRHLFQGQSDKRVAYAELKQALDLQDDEIAYVGDDWLDLCIMRQVGLAIAVQNAHPTVKEVAHWTTEKRGGQCAVREVCDRIIQAQGKWDELLQCHLQ